MIDPTNVRYQRLCIWCGVGFMVLFFIALILAGFIPPPAPTMTGAELLEQFRGNEIGTKLMMPIALVAAGLAIPWNGLISAHILRIEQGNKALPILAITSFGGGILNNLFFFLPFVFWAAAYYRVDRAPEVFLMISDMAWLEVVMMFSPAVVQNICIALAGFADKSANPVFPRWCCFAMLWIALLLAPGCLAIFFFTGPFSWNGLIVFWIPATVFGLSIQILAYVMLRYAKIQGKTA